MIAVIFEDSTKTHFIYKDPISTKFLNLPEG